VLPPRPDRRAQNRRVKRLLAVLFSLIAVQVGLVACVTVMPGSSFEGPLPKLGEREVAYERELREHVKVLAGDIGERHLGVPDKLDKALVYIEDALRKAGHSPKRLGFEVAGRTVYNLEVEQRGSTKPDEIVIIGAHYDSADGAPAADDNASGVAATIALARTFAGRPTARTLRFVAFVNEEPPHFWTASMGSLVYANACKAKGEAIVAMLSLESIGYFSDVEGSQMYPFPFNLVYPKTGNFIAFVGNTDSRGLTRDVIRTFRAHATLPSEGAAPPGKIPGVGWSDHWSFWQNGYPAVMVTDTATFRNPHYHTAHDTPETLDYGRAARVAAGVERVVAELAEAR
jgi:hypothetical protein